MTERLFTRADIEKLFNQFWGKEQEPMNLLDSIDLLPELSPPTWLVSYRSVYRAPAHITYRTFLVVQKRGVSGPYLNLSEREPLPVGCTTAQEEDAEIMRRKAAEREALRKRDDTAHS